MKTTAALLLIIFTVLCYFEYESRQEQHAQPAALDEACSAERDQLAAGDDVLPAKRNLACISWQDPKAPDIHTPRG